MTWLKNHLKEGPAFYPEDQLTDRNLRFIASEIIREKAMELTHQELPYSIAVEIISFKEEKDMTRIEANDVVEKDSQKGMVIGAKAKMIREIGVRARPVLEMMMGGKVFLGLHAKVDRDWTRDPAKLAHYGYAAPQERKIK
jgi:GTP-binding protein Era